MNTSLIRNFSFLILATLVLPIATLQAQRVDAVVAAIKQEAETKAKTKSMWDAAKQDYFARNPKHQMTQPMLLSALSRRLDSRYAIDSYIKWQLVALVKPMKHDEVNAFAMRKLFQALPVTYQGGVAPQPPVEIDIDIDFKSHKKSYKRYGYGYGSGYGYGYPYIGYGRLYPYWRARGPILNRTSNDALVYGPVYAPRYSYNEDFARARSNFLKKNPPRKVFQPKPKQFAELGNGMNWQYRDALFEKLPQAAGWRFQFLLHDLNDRIVIHDATFATLLERLDKQSALHAGGIGFTLQQKRKVMNDLNRLKRIHLKHASELYVTYRTYPYVLDNVDRTSEHQAMIAKIIQTLN